MRSRWSSRTIELSRLCATSSSSFSLSHVADAEGLCQRGRRVSFGNELLREITLKSGFDDRLTDGRVIQFLGVVDLVPSGVATGVEMPDVLLGIADRADDIAFHDLHVVDVVEQLEARRTDLLAQFDAPFRPIVHV